MHSGHSENFLGLIFQQKFSNNFINRSEPANNRFSLALVCIYIHQNLFTTQLLGYKAEIIVLVNQMSYIQTKMYTVALL